MAVGTEDAQPDLSGEAAPGKSPSSRIVYTDEARRLKPREVKYARSELCFEGRPARDGVCARIRTWVDEATSRREQDEYKPAMPCGQLGGVSTAIVMSCYRMVVLKSLAEVELASKQEKSKSGRTVEKRVMRNWNWITHCRPCNVDESSFAQQTADSHRTHRPSGHPMRDAGAQPTHHRTGNCSGDAGLRQAQAQASPKRLQPALAIPAPGRGGCLHHDWTRFVNLFIFARNGRISCGESYEELVENHCRI